MHAARHEDDMHVINKSNAIDIHVSWTQLKEKVIEQAGRLRQMLQFPDIFVVEKFLKAKLAF